jgi:mannose/fructose/N-acetylgalactosamine-specific phosphotransferase system component IIC
MDEARTITPLPKKLPITAVILLILGLVLNPMIDSIFTEEQLSRNALLIGIPFVLIFAAIVIFYMSLAWYMSNKLNFKVEIGRYQLIERIIIASIVLGIFFMFQPWVFVLFRYGFYLLTLATLAFIVWSHVAPMQSEEV